MEDDVIVGALIDEKIFDLEERLVQLRQLRLKYSTTGMRRRGRKKKAETAEGGGSVAPTATTRRRGRPPKKQ